MSIQTDTDGGPRNPQQERFNKTLQLALAVTIDGIRNDWDELLPWVTMFYRQTAHSSTHKSPFEVVFGYAPHLPAPNEVLDPLERCIAWNLVQEHIAKAQAKQKRAYDKKVKPVRYNIGDLVSVWFPPREKLETGQITSKFVPSMRGPYRIKRELSPSTVEVELVTPTSTAGPLPHPIVNINRLAHYVARPDVGPQAPEDPVLDYHTTAADWASDPAEEATVLMDAPMPPAKSSSSTDVQEPSAEAITRTNKRLKNTRTLVAEREVLLSMPKEDITFSDRSQNRRAFRGNYRTELSRIRGAAAEHP